MGENVDGTEPDRHAVVESCSFCSCIVSYQFYECYWHESDLDKEIQHFFFHQQCTDCADLSKKESLCEFCEHLRLGHLVRCGMYGDWLKRRFNIDDPEGASWGITVSFGKLQDIRQRAEHCESCCIILQTMKSEHCKLDDSFYFRLHPLDRSDEFDFYIDCKGDRLAGVLRSLNLAERFDLQRLQPPLRVDWLQVRAWLEGCNKEHGAECNPGSLQSAPPGFRLIDTEKGFVVVAPPHPCTYAALSYVWGVTADSYVRATKSTMEELETEGYLFNHPLPATIQDAICACSHLKIRYLWVDRLCIVQDDEATKDAQINAMGAIYRHSSLTLVDLEGLDMNHGLPGVTEDRYTVPTIYQTQGMCLRTVQTSYDNLVRRSKWCSRGWTFQEAMFSPKMLLFTNTGVFYECPGYDEAFQEDRFVLERREGRRFCFSAFDYGDLLSEFTGRTLTFDSDILKAISGILHWRYGSEHYFGIPFCEFPRGMLWYPSSERNVARTQEAGSMFPSWSWSSVIGKVQLPYLWYHPILSGVWVIPSTGIEKAPVHIIRPHTERREWDEAAIIRGLEVVLAWKKGCFLGRLPPMLNVNTTWRQYSDMIRSKWASLDHLIEEALGLNEIDFDRMFPSFAQGTLHPGSLLTHTQSVRVQGIELLEKEKAELHTTSGNLAIERDFIDMNWEWLSDNFSKNPDLCFDVLALSFMDEQNYSFIGSAPQNMQKYWYDSDGDTLRWDLHDPKSDFVTFKANVMVVETKDGVSRRIGIAKCYLQAWVSVSPEIRSFILV
ncbi:HET-domain-containing protein [Aspergillus sclerotiicarbonarius CBS 121057]|uniref:HET-domain-containing protein n=1 Tax=Aspergillus sclerotiicarbonarius (strain CBS 121057 / IBT 28362) TaxID=1448318 RepID=A0A319EHQ0_ASPSB|nr:HET-domain-containing protein [Aspergillus sclerotiicarbonarius CBS 121057]